jgi:hypothetical protein
MTQLSSSAARNGHAVPRMSSTPSASLCDARPIAAKAITSTASMSTNG